MKTQLVSVHSIQHRVIYQPPRIPGHAAWVSLWKNQNQELFVSFQEMEGDRKMPATYDFMKEENRARYDIRQKIYRSPDQGTHWDFASERELFLPNFSFIACKDTLPSGKILAACAARSLPEFHGCEGKIILISSCDGGLNWQFENMLDNPDCQSLHVTSILHDQNAGILLCAYSNTGDCYCFVSDNEGKSWKQSFCFAKHGGNLSFWEPSLVKTAENQYLCIMRTHREDIPKHNGINYHLVGLTRNNQEFQFSDPMDTGIGFRGKPDLFKSSSGLVIFSAPGHLFAFSADDGKTWEIHLDVLSGLPHNADPCLVEMMPNHFLCAYFFGSDHPFPPPCNQYIGCTSFEIQR